MVSWFYRKITFPGHACTLRGRFGWCPYFAYVKLYSYQSCVRYCSNWHMVLVKIYRSSIWCVVFDVTDPGEVVTRART